MYSIFLENNNNNIMTLSTWFEFRNVAIMCVTILLLLCDVSAGGGGGGRVSESERREGGDVQDNVNSYIAVHSLKIFCFLLLWNA